MKSSMIYACISLLFLSISGVSTAREAGSFHCRIPGEDRRLLARAEFRIEEKETVLRYSLWVRNLSNITMAHLHLGKTGEIGTPVVWLYPGSPPPRLIPGEFEGVLAEGTITSKDLIGPFRGRPLSDLIQEMKRGNTYVNIHTLEHPGGEICGPVLLNQ